MGVGDVVRRILGLTASQRRISHRMRDLEATATTAGTANRIRDVLKDTCAAGHTLGSHTYSIVTSVPMPATEEETRAVLTAFGREAWSELKTRFGFGPGKSLDIVAIRCPDDSRDALAIMSSHDPYEADVILERRQVSDPQILLTSIDVWESFDQPRALGFPIP